MSKVHCKSIPPALIETIMEIEDTLEQEYVGSYDSPQRPRSRSRSPLTSFLCPAFNFLRWIGFTHYRFSFDENSQTFRSHSGSRLRRIVCFIIQVSGVIHSSAQHHVRFSQMRSSLVYPMYTLMAISYFLCATSFFYAMMTKGNHFRAIFTYVHATSNKIEKVGCVIPCQRWTRLVSVGLLAFYLLFVLFYTSVQVVLDHSILSQVENLSMLLPSIANRLIWPYRHWFAHANATEPSSYNVAEHHSFFSVAILVLVFTCLEAIVCLAWLVGFLVNTLFGLMFWKVLHNFFTLVGKSSIRNTLEDVRKFNAITGIIDLYNIAFGWVIFTGVLTGVAFYSVNFVDIFKDTQPWHAKVIVGWSFIFFGLQMLSAAQVNHKAGDIVDMIKLRYQMEPVWREYHGHCIETTQGILLLQHEIASNKIGFRGLGFFTITYSFLGTVLSAISTYAVVVMQLE